MKAVVAALVSLWLPLAAHAITPSDQAVVSWQAVTQNTDGTRAVITGYRVEYGQGNFSHSVVTSAQQVVLSALAPGLWQFRAFALEGAVESAASNIATKTTAASLKVFSPTAYTLVKETDQFVFLPVGTIPVGTLCDSTQRANDLNVVPRIAVTFTGSVQPVVVLAKCM